MPCLKRYLIRSSWNTSTSPPRPKPSSRRGNAASTSPEPNGSATAGLQRATTKWDLRPKLLMLNDALGVLSSGQRMFLSAMVSFYNAREGGAMLKRCGFEGLSDLGGLDLERRKVVADLTLNYNGW